MYRYISTGEFKSMVTLSEIAREAGVSKSTVSKALLGGGGKTTKVSDRTVRLVRETADKLGYRPNLVAQQLAHRKNDIIGVIIDSFSREIIVAPADETHSRVNVDVYVSPQFFGWLSGLGGDVIIEGPASVRSEYRDFLQKIANEYNS